MLLLGRDQKWDYEPSKDIRVGGHVAGGDVIGLVHESVLIKHRILVPPNVREILQNSFY